MLKGQGSSSKETKQSNHGNMYMISTIYSWMWSDISVFFEVYIAEGLLNICTPAYTWYMVYYMQDSDRTITHHAQYYMLY